MRAFTSEQRMIPMSDKKPSKAYLAVKWLVRAVYPVMQVEGLQNLPEGEAVIVGNHAQLHGPVAAELFLDGNRYTWCAGEMMTYKDVPAYAYRDFWSGKPRSVRWLYRIASYLIAPLAVLIFNNANTIAVYHDMRVMNTFRTTLRKLKEGARIVIFPEHAQPHNDIVCDFQQRFVDLAKMHYNATGRALAFVPMYTAPALKKMVLGKPILYHPEADMDEERVRICNALMDAITDLARGLPRHTVIPYLNLSKKDYPFNRPE